MSALSIKAVPGVKKEDGDSRLVSEMAFISGGLSSGII